MKRLALASAFFGLLVGLTPASGFSGDRASGNPLVVPLIDYRNTGMAGCSGALISPRLVYTAAHCMYGADEDERIPKSGRIPGRRIFVGEPGVDVGAGKTTWAIAQFVPSGFRPSTTTTQPFNDFAVLVLLEPLSNSRYEIATAEEIRNLNAKDLAAFAVGYGWHNYQERSSGIKEPFAASTRATILGDQSPERFPTFFNTRWASGIYAGGGDSGSPLWYQRDGEWRYIGAMCCSNGPSTTTAPNDPIWNDPYWSRNAGGSYHTAQAFPEVIDAANNFLIQEVRNSLKDIEIRIAKTKKDIEKLLSSPVKR